MNNKIYDKNTLAEKTKILFEYPQIMEKVSGHAVSEEAAVILKTSTPFYNVQDAVKTKEQVVALHTLIKEYGGEPRSWLPSIGFLFPKIETQGTVFDLDEALAVGLFVERSIELITWISKHSEEANSNVSLYSLHLVNLWFDISAKKKIEPISGEIFKIIDREGNLRDLPVLRAIKKRILSLEKDLKTTISRYSSQEEYKRMLQSPLPSQRDGRTVIALKANFRGRIAGIVHEASSSGQTIFVEPLDVVEKNNEILLEKHNLDAEIQKLMRELTEKIAAHLQDLKNLHITIIELECLRARARYSMAAKGNFTKEPCKKTKALYLLQAKHPMLKNPVPINIEMNNTTTALIITGPNTGGKTVALKTLGLLAMMNQSALALPLDEGSILPFFDGIYADIGDEQSIDQSLSTFSAHIANISSITANATENSLVLLDELGSGTDPQEGGAIAMAILDHLIEKKTRMIVTTHHGILKNYGYTKESVENASMEFNKQTLSPTYKIINGLPGESRALDIAEKNGLDSKIIKAAKNYISEEKHDVSALIKGLEEKHRELALLEQKSTVEQYRLREEKRKIDLKELQLRQKEAELKRESLGNLQNFLRESRKTLENLVRELKEGEITREKTLKVKEFLNDMAKKAEIESAALDEEDRALQNYLKNISKDSTAGKAVPEAFEFACGMEVFAGASKQMGVIVRAEKKDKWLVKIGSLKMIFHESELSLVPQNLTANKTKKAPNGKTAVNAEVSWAADYVRTDAVFELKLIGMRLEEALEALRRQIEAASLSGFKNFSVIHGKGSGILQKGIHDYLKNEKAVADYYFSRPELGGFGRTEVVLY